MTKIYMNMMSTGGMPQMVFEYVLKKHGINPEKDLKIDQSIDFGSTAAAFSADLAVVPREKPHTGAAAREQPRDSPVIER